MSDRLFFDSNILIYALDRMHGAKADIAVSLLRHAIEAEIGLISYQVIHEFYNVAFSKFRPPLTDREAHSTMKSVFGAFQIVPSTPGLIERAFELRERFRFHWYDCLIIAAAIEGDCDVLYSEDLQDGQRFGELVVKNPFRA